MLNKLKLNWRLQSLALWTHVKHETKRMFRIPMQVFLPSMINTLLYFLIFGAIIGKRIGTIGAFNYSVFIAPGLVMIAVITNAYANTASSLFSARFQHSIEELLVSPMHPGILLLGYVLGGMIRGIIVGFCVILVARLFIDIAWHTLPGSLLLLALFSALFSLAGFINGMLARNFDDVFLVPTFILSPLTYLGGVFYSVDMLPPFWHHLTQFNPILYMVNALRYVMIDQAFEYFYLAISLIGGLVIVLAVITIYMLKKGIGMRS